MIYFITEDSTSARRLWEVIADNYLGNTGISYQVRSTYGITCYEDYIENMLENKELNNLSILIAIIDDFSHSYAFSVYKYLGNEVAPKVKNLIRIAKYTAEEIFISFSLLPDWLKFVEKTDSTQRIFIDLCNDMRNCIENNIDYWENPTQNIVGYQRAYKSVTTKEQMAKNVIRRLTQFIGAQMQVYGTQRHTRSKMTELKNSNLGDCWQLDCKSISTHECKNCGLADIEKIEKEKITLRNPYTLETKIELLEANSVMKTFDIRFSDMRKIFAEELSSTIPQDTDFNYDKKFH